MADLAEERVMPDKATFTNVGVWSAVNEETRDGDVSTQLYSPLQY